MRSKRPTIEDVARRAGVSRQTVSRVINGKGEISAGTHARVQVVIEELGYRPSAVAQSMVAGHTRTLGCISPNFSDYTFARIIEAAQDEARRHGYFILAGSARSEVDVEPLLEEMLDRQVDGLLAINPRADGRNRFFPPLLKRGLAVVYLGNSPHGTPVSSVRCNDREGGYRATRLLIDLGHTEIATLLGPTNEECAIDRLNGFLQARAEAGLAEGDPWVARGDWSASSGYRLTMGWLEEGRPFSALFAQNDQMAVGAIRALREAGLRVPGDVSVIGFDDIPLASYFDPPLTTFRQPMEESGRRAAQLLISTIQNPDREPEQVLIEAQLIERGSCAPAKHRTPAAVTERR